MKRYNINGISARDYEGTGTPLVFIHAFPLHSGMWDGQVEYFKQKYRVITFDVRGLGESRTQDNQFVFETLVDDFFNLLDHLEIEKANVCGLSMGGYITLRSAVRNQERFNSMILAGSRSNRDDDAGILGRSKTFSEIKSGKKHIFAEDFVKKLINPNSYKNTELRNFLFEMIDSQADEGICGTLIALATRTNTKDELNKINIPALVMTGEDDILTPFENSELIHKNLNKSELKKIKNAGHLSNLENPDEFNLNLDAFLKGLA